MAFSTEQEVQILSLLAQLGNGKTLRQIYNDNPSAGGNAEASYLVFGASADGLSDVVFTTEQLAGILSRLIGVSVPEGKFRATVNNNSLVVTVGSVVGLTYSDWMITVDNPVAPLSTDSGWIQGTLGGTKLLQGTATETWRAYIKEGDTVTLVDTDDGLGYITLTANMIGTPQIVKDPDNASVLEIDWSPWLTTNHGAITDVTWTLDSPLVEDSSLFLTDRAVLIYSNGVVGANYDWSCQITYTDIYTGATGLTKTVSSALRCAQIDSLEVSDSLAIVDTRYR